MKDGVNAAILAKLAAQAADYYDFSYQLLSTPSLVSQVPKVTTHLTHFQSFTLHSSNSLNLHI